MRGFEKIHRIISKKVKKCKTKSRNSRLATKNERKFIFVIPCTLKETLFLGKTIRWLESCNSNKKEMKVQDKLNMQIFHSVANRVGR